MQKFVLTRRVWAYSALVFAAVAGVVLPTYAQPTGPAGGEAGERGESVYQITAPRSRLQIVERSARVVELATKIVRVDGFDPEVIEVSALTPNQIRVAAIAPGVTTMVLLDERNQMYTIDVFITGDVRHLQAYIGELFPNASIQAVEVRESVVLRGWVTQPEHITEMIDIAEQFYPKVINQIRVGGVQQVMLNVKVMEVQRSKIRRLGFNFLYLKPDSYLLSTPGQLVLTDSIDLSDTGTAVGFVSGSLSDSTISFGVADPSKLFQGFIEALKEEGLLKIMAEPSLVTTNGRPATMLSGGEFPILVPQSLGTTTIEWREFGVRMQAVPIILGNGRVRLELEPEVSERDFANSVEINGSIVPGLTSRRANTQVEMNFGQTLVIAGLISQRDTANYSKVPLLGDIPLLSTAFSRKRFDEVETELVITVTPELVAPMDDDQVPYGGPGRFTDAPTFREMFHGNIEVPKCGDECEGCIHCWTDEESYCPDGTYGSEPMPANPPAPAADGGMTQTGNPFTRALGRLNPFGRSKSAPAGFHLNGGVQQTNHARSGGSQPARHADYQTDNRRRTNLEHAGGTASQPSGYYRSEPSGWNEPQPGLIVP